jgi:5-methylcytosine-specific restriction enzyme subunit McrC
MPDRHQIRLCEWSSVEVADIPTATRRDLLAASECWRRENALPHTPLTFGGADGTVMSASHYVGVIEVNGYTVEIYPKLDDRIVDAREVNDETTASSVMRHLLWMLDIAGYMDLAEADAAHLDVAEVSYYDLFAFLFAKNVLRELERGVIHNYLTTEDDTTAIRGRIDLVRQSTRNWGRNDVHYCRWDEFTPDTPMNRLLRCATRNLQTRVRNPEPVALLANCAALLEDVTEVDPRTAIREANVRWDRSNERFRRSFEMARRLLAGSSYELTTGQEDVFVFLLDMNNLFESFVTAAVSARFGVPVVDQESIGHLLFVETRGHIEQKPDLQWRVGARKWIGDAKYKRLFASDEPGEEVTLVDGSRLGPADARQLTCYGGIVGRHAEVPNLAVFYPLVGDRTPTITEYRTWNDSRLYLVPVRVDRAQPAADTIPIGPWMTDANERKAK